MAYNNGRENRKWLIWKEAEEKILREHGVFSSYNMIFYFHFEGRDILYCPTKTILNPPMIIFCKDMELTSPKNIS